MWSWIHVFQPPCAKRYSLGSDLPVGPGPPQQLVKSDFAHKLAGSDPPQNSVAIAKILFVPVLMEEDRGIAP